MKILIFKNSMMKSISTVENYIIENNLPYELIVFQEGGTIPDVDPFDTLVILGGYMSVNDVDAFPFLLDEIKVILDFVNSDKKIFGICLGSQLMAKALGENVYRGHQKELGWQAIQLKPEYEEENKINKLGLRPDKNIYNDQIKVFHWHNDTFNLPEGAKLLATNGMYKNQAFKYLDKAYAMQFHIEVNQDMINEWLGLDNTSAKEIKADSELFLKENVARANNFYNYFFLNLK